MLPSRFALRARYIFPVDQPPIADGVLAVDDGRIVEVAEWPDQAAVIDLGNVAIVPGFVNAHAHLEFSDLNDPLGQPGMALPDWIRLVLEYRSAPERPPYPQRVEMGLSQCLQHGTTTVGEIATTEWPATAWTPLPLDVVAFRELICPARKQVSAAVNAAYEHLQLGQSSTWHPGFSPHAPFTVHPEFWQHAVAVSRDLKAPLATHLAESPEEIAWLRDGSSGPLADLLAERSAVGAPASTAPQRPLDYLRLIAQAHRAIVVHGNYLDEEEIAFMADHADRLSLVYCPRTHSFFQHQPHPVQQLLATGANVAMGTDGRGSNPDLSILAELRHVAASHPALPLDRILSMGTLAGAQALGLADRIGSMTPGKDANLAIIRLPDDGDLPAHELLLHSDQPAAGTIYRGKIVHASTQLSKHIKRISSKRPRAQERRQTQIPNHNDQ